ncbi:MAG TPA: hypothetical protein VEX86_28775 [Longimicrobium sp.]|nr:hypothetical protein [Longimicrobium sp.]
MSGNGIGRRAFMDRVMALGAAVGLGSLGGAATARAAGTTGAAGTAAEPDESWLRRLTGRHKQLFDAPHVDGGRALVHIRNYMNAYRDDYALRDADVSALLILYAGTVPLAFRDEAWAAFELGKKAEVDDGDAPSKRNLFRSPAAGYMVPPDAGLDALMRRGVVVVLCNNSLNRWVREISAAGHGSVEDVRRRMDGWLIPGITMVPAAVMAVNRAQEGGCTYFYSG